MITVQCTYFYENSVNFLFILAKHAVRWVFYSILLSRSPPGNVMCYDVMLKLFHCAFFVKVWEGNECSFLLYIYIHTKQTIRTLSQDGPSWLHVQVCWLLAWLPVVVGGANSPESDSVHPYGNQVLSFVVDKGINVKEMYI